MNAVVTTTMMATTTTTDSNNNRVPKRSRQHDDNNNHNDHQAKRSRPILLQPTLAHANQESLRWLQQGETTRAIASWRTALEVVQASVQGQNHHNRLRHNPPAASIHTNTNTNTNATTVQRIAVQHVRLPPLPTDLPGNPTVSPNGSFCFCNHVFAFHQQHDDDNELAAALILYNLAVVYHRQAMLQNTTARYRKALFLYGLAQSLYESVGSTTTSTTSTAPLLERHNNTNHNNYTHYPNVTYALVCNMGHIYSHLYEMRPAQACLDYLLQHRALFWNHHDVSSSSSQPDDDRMIHSGNFVLATQVHAASMA